MSDHTIVLNQVVDETEEQQILEIIRKAWAAYQPTERYGFAFGQAIYECGLRFATCGGVGNKGKGIRPMLDQLNIPKSTAYWWRKRYMVSVGLEATPPEPDDREFDGTEYQDLTTITEILDNAEPTICHWPPVAMMIAQPQLNASPRRCSICGETTHTNICTACGLPVCSHCWPNHASGHPANLNLYRERSKLEAATPTTELVRQVELALHNALRLWPREKSLQKLREAIEVILDRAMRQRKEEVAVIHYPTGDVAQ